MSSWCCPWLGLSLPIVPSETDSRAAAHRPVACAEREPFMLQAATPCPRLPVAGGWEALSVWGGPSPPSDMCLGVLLA